jgi:hypothetical protein
MNSKPNVDFPVVGVATPSKPSNVVPMPALPTPRIVSEKPKETVSAVEPVIVPPAPAKVPQKPKKAAESIAVPFTLGALKSLANLHVRLLCTEADCDSEWTAPFSSMVEEINEMDGRLAWSFVMFKNNTLAGYCYLHKPPRKTEPFTFHREKR